MISKDSKKTVYLYVMYKIPLFLLKCIMRLLGALPLGFHYACGRVLSWLAGDVLRYRRDVVTTNLARSFPDLKYNELKAIRKDFYRHFGDIFAEAVWFGGCRGPKRLRRQHIVELKNPELLNHLYDVSPSVMIFNSHCGNWELFGGTSYYNYVDGLELSINEANVRVVYKKMSSRVWDEFFKANRIAPLKDRDSFEGLIETREIMRYALSHKGEKLFYNLNTDQGPYKGSTGIDVGEFLHQHTYSMAGGATLARKLHMSVVYMNMSVRERGHYDLTFTTICEDASTMSAEDIMKSYYSLLQKDIEAQPANYLWTHKRWKI